MPIKSGIRNPCAHSNATTTAVVARMVSDKHGAFVGMRSFDWKGEAPDAWCVEWGGLAVGSDLECILASYVYSIPDADIEGHRPGAMCLLSAPAEVQPGLARIADVHFLSLGLL